MADSQNTSFSVAFAKQDKELAQFASTPVPTKSEAGDLRCTFNKDSTMRMHALATQISPASFAARFAALRIADSRLSPP